MSLDAPLPVVKNAMAFFDGQNLYRHAKDAFGHHHPNYDPVKLHKAVCAANGWRANLTRFYTGVPDLARDPAWAGYWNKRILAMKRAGIVVEKRQLRYQERLAYNKNGDEETIVFAQEKRIDVRIALDIVSLAIKKQYDVAIIFSQDQDLCEVVSEVNDIAKLQGRQIEICCAFPAGPDASSGRGIDRTDWFRMYREFYDMCLDPYDYRPKA